MPLNPFTAKARSPKLRSFGAGKPSIVAQNNGGVAKNSPWAKKIAEAHEKETRGVLHQGSEKADYTQTGIRYANCRDHGTWWSIDVSTGDVSMTFHNRYGSWLADLDESDGGRRIEPQREVAFGCQARYIAELKRIGAELPYFMRTAADRKESDKKAEASKAGKKPPPKKKPKPKPEPATPAKPKVAFAAAKPRKLKGWGK